MALRMDITTQDRWFTNTDYEIPFQILQNDEVTPQDITGWTFTWMLKIRKGDPDVDAIITKTSPTGVDIVNAATGLGRVLIADDDTDEDVKSGVYWHELKRTGAGVETVPIQGRATLQKSLHLT